MRDLVSDFFKVNFNEDEWLELERLVQSKPEEANRLASLAEKAYLKTGLPPPQWPQGVPLRPLKGPAGALNFNTWIGLSAVILLSGVYMAWRTWPPRTFQAPLKAAPQPESLGIIPKKDAPASRKLSTLPPPPMAVPQKAEGGGEAGQLSVVVELENPEPVTVKVFNTASHQLERVLFTGPLGAGQWWIRWDGLLSDGKPAPSGDHRIQVQAGPNLLTKSVEIADSPGH